MVRSLRKYCQTAGSTTHIAKIGIISTTPCKYLCKYLYHIHALSLHIYVGNLPQFRELDQLLPAAQKN